MAPRAVSKGLETLSCRLCSRTEAPSMSPPCQQPRRPRDPGSRPPGDPDRTAVLGRDNCFVCRLKPNLETAPHLLPACLPSQASLLIPTRLSTHRPPGGLTCPEARSEPLGQAQS